MHPPRSWRDVTLPAWWHTRCMLPRMSRIQVLRLLTLGVFATASACSDGDKASDLDCCRPTGPFGTIASANASVVWRQRAPLPTPRAEVASAVWGGRIYVIAGFDAQGNNTNLVEAYEPGSDRWRRLTPLPEPRDHAMAAAFAGKVYVFGGGGREGASNTVFAYDPASDSWSRR